MDIKRTDPEYAEILDRFAESVETDETAALPDKERYMAVIAALVGCGGVDVFRGVLSDAIDSGALSPAQIKEIVYQATDYLGFGRTFPFLNAANEVLVGKGISLPLPGNATVTRENRLEKGVQTQAEIFGEQMREAWKAGTVNKWLAENCFGDYYTRKGLEIRERELITFCFIMAQGGCEPQLTAHAKGNMNVGNDAGFLTRVVLQCLPYIGYPRSLNALGCIKNAAS